MTSGRKKFFSKGQANDENHLAVDLSAGNLKRRVHSSLWMTTNHEDVVCHFMETSVHNLVIHAETEARLKKNFA